MKKIFILCLGIGLLFSYRGFGQVGEKVFSVNILNMNNDTVALPMLGQKNLLIFYADPSHPGQNKTFRDYFKTHPVSGLEITSYGIVNLAAAPMLPNALIKRMALKEVKGTDLDENAIVAVGENLKANGIEPEQFQVMQGNILDDPTVQQWAGFGCYDVAVANILADVIIPLVDEIPVHLKKGGIFISCLLYTSPSPRDS